MLPGALIQWIVRLALGFNIGNLRRGVNAVFGGISLAALFYFILIKGIKGSPLASISFDFLDGKTIPDFVQSYNLSVFFVSFLIWTIVSFLLQKFVKADIYKIVIGVGTFALALAFAGNDLVNFIGVPIAAYQSFELWIGSGISPELFSMEMLEGKVRTPVFFLIMAGIIMVITLWISSKAKRVVKTSIDLSNQHQVNERFKSNLLASGLVYLFNRINKSFVWVLPNNFRITISKQFTPIDLPLIGGIRPAFDKIRASINLVIAALLISWATSLKLPLSTTYVTFMVTMGTSLSDRAWQRGSAVYRVSGVLNVIGGWFITALCAFTISAIISGIIELWPDHFGYNTKYIDSLDCSL